VLASSNILSSFIEFGVLSKVDSATVVFIEIEDLNVSAEVANLLKDGFDLESFLNGVS